MATDKLVDKLSRFLNLDRQKQKEKRAKIRLLLKKMKKQQRALEEKLENTADADKRKRIKRDLKVLHAQRKKGIKLCREIKCKK
jgi:hypothetical protein